MVVDKYLTRDGATEPTIVEGRNQRVWRVVSFIPSGRVATYKRIAALAGIEGPTGARQVGYALASLKRRSKVPWHRVVNIQGMISDRKSKGSGEEQYDHLTAEGVKFDKFGRIDLNVFEWDYQ